MPFGNLPIDKYLAQDYREIMRTSGSPQNIDDNTPVQVVVPLGIGLGFPRPNSKQILKHYVMNKAADTTTQIITLTSNKSYYFLGAFLANGANAGTSFYISDVASGVIPVGDTSTDDLVNIGNLNAMLTDNKMMPLPILLINGLRARIIPGAANGCAINFFWIEETIQ